MKHLESLCLSELEEAGWPRWNILLDEKGDTNTLGKLNWHLRNAVSHRRLRFSSDHREMDKVEVGFEDAPKANAPPNWRAKINAADLNLFCDLLIKLMEEIVG